MPEKNFKSTKSCFDLVLETNKQTKSRAVIQVSSTIQKQSVPRELLVT